MGALIALLPTIIALLENPAIKALLPLLAEAGKAAFPAVDPVNSTNAAVSLFDTNAVRWVQVALNLLGEKLEMDGIYGDVTKKAVTNFQVDHKIDADGWAGKDTVEALQKALLSVRS